MHRRRTNFSPRCSTTVKAVAERTGSESMGKPCACLHACSQARQPMHLVMSTRIAFVFFMIDSCTPLRQKEFADDALPPFGSKPGEQAAHWHATVLRSHSAERRGHGVQPGNA